MARRGEQRGVRAQRRPTRHACTRRLVAAWCGPTRGALAVQRLGVSAASACARSNGSRGASGGAVAVRARAHARAGRALRRGRRQRRARRGGASRYSEAARRGAAMDSGAWREELVVMGRRLASGTAQRRPAWSPRRGRGSPAMGGTAAQQAAEACDSSCACCCGHDGACASDEVGKWAQQWRCMGWGERGRRLLLSVRARVRGGLAQ